MALSISSFASSSMACPIFSQTSKFRIHFTKTDLWTKSPSDNIAIRCTVNPKQTLRTCKNCKTQFDPTLNHPQACRFHTGHFGGETK